MPHPPSRGPQSYFGWRSHCHMHAATLLVAVASTISTSQALPARPGPLDFVLHSIPQSTYPHAKCLDGSAPAYYWRDGRGELGSSFCTKNMISESASRSRTPKKLQYI